MNDMTLDFTVQMFFVEAVGCNRNMFVCVCYRDRRFNLSAISHEVHMDAEMQETLDTAMK